MLKPLVAAMALTMAAPAMAATCTGTANWGSLGPPGMQIFGNSFSSAGSYLDCYSFSLTSTANSFGGVLEWDWSSLNIDLTAVSLFSGGLSGSSTTGVQISQAGLPDPTFNQFNFGSLRAGTYTLALGANVSGSKGGSVGYVGTISTIGVPVASAAPEPESFAMMLAGLVGVGAMVRRNKKKS